MEFELVTGDISSITRITSITSDTSNTSNSLEFLRNSNELLVIPVIAKAGILGYPTK